MNEAIPAATLVLFRQGDGAPELLFVERSRAMVFAGGALVFPGGRIDPGDRALALDHVGDPDDVAARIAAIRETVEEVGVPIGLPPMPSAMLAELRKALHDGASFGAALAERGLTIAPETLTAFARWLPAHAHARIFDTRFYLAELPDGAHDPVIDATENVRLLWSTAQGVLDAANAGEAHIIFPTRRNLERLAQFRDFAEAAAHAAAHQIQAITPWVEARDGVEHLCIPQGLGYPVTAEPVHSAMRG